MNKEKVFIEGYEVGFLADTTGAREKRIQVASGEIVSIDERFIYKEVEKEKKYIVTLKSSGQKLYYHTEDEDYIFSSYDGVFYSGYHTKTDLEENDMGWVFDCPGIEVEEVKR